MTRATAATRVSADSAPSRGRSVGRRYGSLWGQVPRELGYLALTAVIGVLVLHALTTNIFAASRGGVLVLVTLLLLVIAMVVSRYIGAFELRRLRWARTPGIAAPTWSPVLRGKAPLRALGDIFANGHYWLYGLHILVLNPLAAVVTTSVWGLWLATGLSFTALPIWGPISPFASGRIIGPESGRAPLEARGHGLAEIVLYQLTGRIDPTATGWVIGGLSALGLLMLAVLPFVTRAATLAHWGLARGLLGRFASDDLRADVARVDAARTAAIAAEDTALRRLERDIHDGPQQRLLRLQMELSTAQRRLAHENPATESIDAAHRLATETLQELRALAQGYAPPLLQDRGLSAALGALGRRGAISVHTAIAIEDELPSAVERSLYFIAAELISNAIKHSSAEHVRLEARKNDNGMLLSVTDDGTGGAHIVPNHGLAGMMDRVTGLGGDLTMTSPRGGPTTIAIRIPRP